MERGREWWGVFRRIRLRMTMAGRGMLDRFGGVVYIPFGETGETQGK
jgi:hypothetical protein